LFSVAAVAALAVSTLGGCTTISTLYKAYGPESQPEPVPTRTFSASGLVVLKLGNCLDKAKLEDANKDTDPFVSCTKPHDLEVFSHFALKGDEYPSVESIVSDAAARCAKSFTKFVGVDFGISALDFSYYYPTQSSWAGGDRMVDCVIFDPDGKTTGSLKHERR
jgi:hypothetical protein